MNRIEQSAQWQAAQRFTQQKKWESATDAYRALLAQHPGFAPAWLELSSALEHLGRYQQSRDCVLQAARAGGPMVSAMLGLAIVRRLRRFDEGARMAAYVEATSLHTRLPPDKLVDLVVFFTSAGAYEPALAWVDRALQQSPNNADAHNMRGLLKMFAGDKKESAASFRRALAIRPGFVTVYSTLSRVVTADADTNFVAPLRALLASGLPARDEVHVAYALHNQLHDLGEYDDAWAALTRSFAAKRRVQPYDRARAVALFDAQRRAYADGVRLDRGVPAGDLTPIFIVGMHRSGTTLLERILSGNPLVADAGETYTFTSQLRLVTDHFCDGVADATLVERSQSTAPAEVGRLFLDAIRWRARGLPFITEKLNPNFILLGQIAEAMPAARLLHMRRDPVDTCFSNLRTLFTIEAAYSYDLVEMADYYNDYVQLMKFWHEVAPGRVLDVVYEDLVENSDVGTARVAAYCGFDYDTRMLDVDRSGGMVATASFGHVRQGILRNRGGAWRPYERHVQPLLDRLAAHGLI